MWGWPAVTESDWPWVADNRTQGEADYVPPGGTHREDVLAPGGRGVSAVPATLQLAPGPPASTQKSTASASTHAIMPTHLSAELLSHVQLFATPWTVCSLSGSSVHGILHARILEWVAISFSRGTSRPRDQT